MCRVSRLSRGSLLPRDPRDPKDPRLVDPTGPRPYQPWISELCCVCQSGRQTGRRDWGMEVYASLALPNCDCFIHICPTVSHHPNCHSLSPAQLPHPCLPNCPTAPSMPAQLPNCPIHACPTAQLPHIHACPTAQLPHPCLPNCPTAPSTAQLPRFLGMERAAAMRRARAGVLPATMTQAFPAEARLAARLLAPEPQHRPSAFLILQVGGAEGCSTAGGQ